MEDMKPPTNRVRAPKRPSIQGRPAKNPRNKLRSYLRFTCTDGFKKLVNELAEERGLNESDFVRLALYRFLDAEGKMTERLRAEPTWETLINIGVAPMPDLAKIRAERNTDGTDVIDVQGD